MGDPHRAGLVEVVQGPLDLAGLLDLAWSNLARGVTDRRHGFHTPVVCSIDERSRPTGRTVVLRRADRGRREVVFHADARSPKVAEVRARGDVAWVFYDEARRVQVRALGAARVHAGDAVARERWEASALSSRRCYLGPHAPGLEQVTADPNVPELLRGRTPTAEEAEPGFGNFAAVVCELGELDVLHLAAEGHTRGRFVWTSGGWAGGFVSP